MEKEKIEKNSNGKLTFKKLLKRVKLRHLILLLLLLVVNTYAWFIYISKASMSLSLHVSSWDVKFKVGEEISTSVSINVDELYPGVDDYEQVITAINSGETGAVLTYEIKELQVFGEIYSVSSGEYTSEDLLDMIENDFPFDVNINIDQGNIEEQGGEGTFTIIISWAYESGDDEFDTEWGEKAYDYYENNLDEYPLIIELELIATQPET